MPPIEVGDLTAQSLRDYGLGGTIALLTLIYLIVLKWKQVPASHTPSPIQAVDEKTKLLPLILEEIREQGRAIRDIREQLENIDVRLGRMEVLSEIIKDRQRRE